MLFKNLFLCASLLISTANATDLWVPPPERPTKDGTPILVDKESLGQGSLIIHLHKPQQTDWHWTTYGVNLNCKGEHSISANLRTRAFERDDEVLFLTIPASDQDKCVIYVVNESTSEKVYHGTLSLVPDIK